MLKQKGDNCATIIVGDHEEEAGSMGGKDWRGVPYKLNFDSDEEKTYFEKARHLVQTTRESLYAAIEVCTPGNCLSDIGGAIQDKADANHYCTVEKYRGHGISHQFHCAPYVKVSCVRYSPLLFTAPLTSMMYYYITIRHHSIFVILTEWNCYQA